MTMVNGHSKFWSSLSSFGRQTTATLFISKSIFYFVYVIVSLACSQLILLQEEEYILIIFIQILD